MENEKSDFIRLTQASREVIHSLEIYAEILVEWNEKFNLVAPSTLTHIWSRHFLDSAQLRPLLGKQNGVLADMGSGAGFPGLVLNIMGVPMVHLIESTGKKADFLRAIVEKLDLSAIIHQCRVEELDGFKADIVTARAVAPLRDLLTFADSISKKDTLCLFLKGKKAESELTEAAKSWMFICDKTQSLSDSSGTILAIRDLHAKHRSKPGRRK